MGVAFAVLALVACRDEMPDMQDPRANTDIYNWSQLFDCYWTGMNYNLCVLGYRPDGLGCRV